MTLVSGGAGAGTKTVGTGPLAGRGGSSFVTPEQVPVPLWASVSLSGKWRDMILCSVLMG